MEWVKAPECTAPSKPTSGGANSEGDAGTAITWISGGWRLEAGDTKGVDELQRTTARRPPPPPARRGGLRLRRSNLVIAYMTTYIDGGPVGEMEWK